MVKIPGIKEFKFFKLRLTILVENLFEKSDKLIRKANNNLFKIISTSELY